MKYSRSKRRATSVFAVVSSSTHFVFSAGRQAIDPQHLGAFSATVAGLSGRLVTSVSDGGGKSGQEKT